MMKRELYPTNWEAISLAIRQRAQWRCEFCGAEYQKPNPETGSIVILTVAHLDHDPQNCDPENLKALCQRCHLRYDAKLHAKHAAETRRNKQLQSGQLSLFVC